MPRVVPPVAAVAVAVAEELVGPPPRMLHAAVARAGGGGGRCRHFGALPPESCSFCSLGAPVTLLDICIEYIVANLEETLCVYDGDSWRLAEGVALPVELCERLLSARAAKAPKIDTKFVKIFQNLLATKLKRVKLKHTDVDDDGLRILLRHRLVELEISNSTLITEKSIKTISKYGNKLISLTIGKNVDIFPYRSFGPAMLLDSKCYERHCIFWAENLRRLCIRNTDKLNPQFFIRLLQPFEKLTHLDLSSCSNLSNLKYIEHLTNLTSLVLYNVYNIEIAVPSICKLENLRHLDLSQSKDIEEMGKFNSPTLMLSQIAQSLRKLRSLDISGTNLAGTGVAEFADFNGKFASDIPGLGCRVNNPLHFLGLYETHHDACLRHDIPAKLIAGNANEEQILVAAMAYLDRSEMLQKVLNELFHLFRFESCEHVGQALHIVLESMNRHLMKRHIQISGSATLFYIVKGTGKELHDVVQVKRRIITTLLNGMYTHRNDDTMMRNGCLTLCQFKIPTDVVYDFERLVEILLHAVYGMPQESFVQRIAIYLLNSIACQVDGNHKVELGVLGTINKMLWLITDRLQRGLCDDVLEVAWSTMWNVTDETPANCKIFLESQGMEYFLKCLEKFPDKEELLRNMMGLLGNVAEVKSLRYYLMRPEYISVFSDLLDSHSDGIEVSYNASGVISHIASDGPEVWTIKEPTRECVLNRMMCSIDRWDLGSQRNINYRSFEPILSLVRVFETPECQRWAVWALANLTKVYPDKYCDVVVSEGGIALLEEIIEHHLPPFSVKELASIVIENCRVYEERYGQRTLDG